MARKIDSGGRGLMVKCQVASGGGYSTRPSYTARSQTVSVGRSLPTGGTGSGMSSQGSSAPKNNFRRVSDSEYQKHRAAGTCFRCGQRYSPTHRCPPRTLNVLLGCEEDDVGEEEDAKETEEGGGEVTEEQNLQLSVLTTYGFDGPQTIKLMGSVGEREVVLMVDSGATHCFISEALARELSWTVEETGRLRVVLGDGSRVATGGLCHRLPIRLNGRIYAINCYVFPLKNVDIILGVSWLASLGDIKANWSTLSLTFGKGADQQTLQEIQPWLGGNASQSN